MADPIDLTDEQFTKLAGILADTLDLMVGLGEAPDHRRAKALITTMFGSRPTQRELREYRASLRRQEVPRD
jgi:hypothetical protein